VAAKATAAAIVAAGTAGKDAGYRTTLRQLRALMKATVPQASESVNPWSLLTFNSADGPVASVLFAARHMSLVFMRGTSLPDPAGLLEGSGKGARHMKLRTPADVANADLRQLIQAAVALNQMEPPNWIGDSRPLNDKRPPVRRSAVRPKPSAAKKPARVSRSPGTGRRSSTAPRPS